MLWRGTYPLLKQAFLKKRFFRFCGFHASHQILVVLIIIAIGADKNVKRYAYISHHSFSLEHIQILISRSALVKDHYWGKSVGNPETVNTCMVQFLFNQHHQQVLGTLGSVNASDNNLTVKMFHQVLVTVLLQIYHENILRGKILVIIYVRFF